MILVSRVGKVTFFTPFTHPSSPREIVDYAQDHFVLLLLCSCFVVFEEQCLPDCAVMFLCGPYPPFGQCWNVVG